MAIDALSAANAAATAKANATTTTNKTATTTESSTDNTAATLNYDSFLRLLVAQMQNQDPTDPVDASEQMSQLASFSNVEQAIKTNSHLESLIQETSLSQATALIGKTITSADEKTTGVVKSVEINSDGLTAVLEDGSRVSVQTGITVAATTTTPTTTDTGNNNSADNGDTTPTNNTGE